MGLRPPDFDSLVQEVIGRGGHLRFQARGSSMQPFIHGGDVIVVEPVAPSQLRRGDIVMRRRPSGSYVLHRLLQVHEVEAGGTLVTKGDNAGYPDLPVAQTEVVGRVIEIERAGRRLRLNRGMGRLVNGLASWLAPWAPWRTPLLRRLGGWMYGGLKPFLWESKR